MLLKSWNVPTNYLYIFTFSFYSNHVSWLRAAIENYEHVPIFASLSRAQLACSSGSRAWLACSVKGSTLCLIDSFW